MSAISSSVILAYSQGLWLGSIPSRYGMIQLVLDGTLQAPREQDLQAIQAFLLNATETIEKLRWKLPFSFLWRPVRLATNSQSRVGIQFQHRILNQRRLLFADEV